MTLAIVGVLGTVLVAVVSGVALVWSSKIQAKAARDARDREDAARKDEREHDARRRAEEREDEARKRLEEREAEVATQERAAAAERERRAAEKRDAWRERQRTVWGRFAAAAERVHQSMRLLSLDYPDNLTAVTSSTDWDELALALAELSEVFDDEIGLLGRDLVHELRAALHPSGREARFTEIEGKILHLSQEARYEIDH